MHIVIINGSPRTEGNTARAMDLIAKAAQDAADVEVTTYHLDELTLKGCQGCMLCKEPGAVMCALEDDLKQVLQDLFEADAWILGTPVYMGHMTGQLKLLLDRTYGYLAPGFVLRLPEGKRGVAVLTQGRKELDAYQGVADMFTNMFTRRKFAMSECLVIGGTERRASGSIELGEEVKLHAALLGKKLTGES